MGEVYLGAFQRGATDVIALDEERVVRPEHAELPQGEDWYGVGTGFAAAEGALQHRFAVHLSSVDANALPHAADLARLAASAYARGEVHPPERVEPAYLRDNVALTLAEQRNLRNKS
jgi:tRNA threonylcarbamoyladenosine biosynthesis protein TsaB